MKTVLNQIGVQASRFASFFINFKDSKVTQDENCQNNSVKMSPWLGRSCEITIMTILYFRISHSCG